MKTLMPIPDPLQYIAPGRGARRRYHGGFAISPRHCELVKVCMTPVLRGLGTFT